MLREEIIKRFTEAHGNKYDYSLVPEGDTKVAVKTPIVCPVHGVFEQEIRGHYQGKGCLQCSSANPGTFESFIKKAEKVHGKRYDYSKSIYLGAREKLEIICREHGSFWSAPTNHHRGKGCPKCGDRLIGLKRRAEAKRTFEVRARSIHGAKYDYSKVKYVRASDNVEIICPSHGSFMQQPASHIQGTGCTKCSDEFRLSRASDISREHHRKTRKIREANFLEKAKEFHGDKYDYSLVRYKNTNTKVKIICPDHGVFEQSPSSHIEASRGGKGCPTCGLRREYPNGYVYVLHGDGKTKIGITYDPKERFRKLKERTPFEFEPVGVWFCDTYDLTFKVEAVMHRHFEEYSSNLKGFDGAKEWFNMTPFEVCDLLTSFLGVPVK